VSDFYDEALQAVEEVADIMSTAHRKGYDYYAVTTPAAGDPVTSGEFTLWGKDVNVADAAIITSLVSAATKQGENRTKNIFVSRVMDGFFQRLDEDLAKEPFPFVEIRRYPVISIDSVETVQGGVLTPIASTNYRLKQRDLEFPRLLFTTTPTFDTDQAYPIVIGFTVGYGNAAAVPDDIKTAIKQHALFMYENRGDVISEGELGMPLEVRNIYHNYIIDDTGK